MPMTTIRKTTIIGLLDCDEDESERQ